jgi:hypothetical protein
LEGREKHRGDSVVGMELGKAFQRHMNNCLSHKKDYFAISKNKNNNIL